MSSPHRVSDNEQQPTKQQQQQQQGKTGNDLLASLAIEKMGQADSSKLETITTYM
jgi:hypothetical protein